MSRRRHPEKRRVSYYVWLHGLTGLHPIVHAMTSGPPYDVDVTVCGLVVSRSLSSWAMADPRNVAGWRRCARCFPS